ncbi:non-ribosomal peptide synthetase [Chengkuizengella sediminis]|uniref:non-ribosomal peptide synthetase n=1 Tax=Chengkuizengella sediminis TaxID=1885917 RepID=UPI001389BF67|nr:non-ribosomal peptide synthetase [Chengkuizengella sediminis]NDI35231.1 amino acid adenylation domain-containing protein [Chengkuizengella sediminis]
MIDSGIRNIYRLTPMQEGMFFHSLFDQNSSAYFEQAVLTLNGTIDPELLERSFNKLLERYDVLRTVFLYKEVDQPLQVVLDKRETSLYYKDFSNLIEKDQNQQIEQYKLSEKKKGFNLEKDILIRMALFKTDEDKVKLIWNFHHIIMDGWCLSILAKDLFQIYFSLKNCSSNPLPEVYPYSDYFTWLEKQDLEGLKYWEKVLEGYEQRATIPASKVMNNDVRYEHKKYSFKLDEEWTNELEKLAVVNQTTLSTVFQAIWGVLLQKYNNTDDVVFGSVISGRPPEVRGIESMVGLFINTVPIRIKTDQHITFKSLLSELNQSLRKANTYGYLSLADIQSSSKLNNDLIQHIVVFENYPMEEVIINDVDHNDQITVLDSEMSEHTNYDLEIIVFPSEQLEVCFTYNGLLYDDLFFKKVEIHLKQIIKQVIKNDSVLINNIEILSQEEKNQILVDFNDTDVIFPNQKTVHQLFEEQVMSNPDQLAVLFKEEKWTYREFNKKANSLGKVLRNKGIKNDTIVAIMLDRSLEMMVGIMGIMKAGGAYMPISPDFPIERIKFMLEDSKAVVILTQEKYITMLSEIVHTEKLQVINLEDSDLYKFEDSSLSNINSSNDLAYMIYTSGSTGNPKGVLIEYRALINRLHWMQKKYPIGEGDVILQKTPFVFDVSVWELFWWCIQGASVCFLEPGGEKEPGMMVDVIEKNQISTMHFVPSMLSVFLDYLENMENETIRLKSLRQVFASGEALKTTQVDSFLKLLHNKNGTNLHNLYGPTEASIDVSYYDCVSIENMNVVPIGKPINNIQLHILDRNLQLMSIGLTGELHISGAGLARGYLNRPELTAEKFIDHPFQPGEKMYKTGDLARWLPDGNIEYLGRNDHQVKIRGHRIELGEIEKHLITHESIQEVVVIARDDDAHLYLCAYFTSKINMNTSTLKSYLSQIVPEYMVPNHFIQLDEMPINSNGKLDRKKLPAPSQQLQTSFVAPRNLTEETLKNIWGQVLEVERISIHQNFFELGGHSLKATLLVSKVYREMNVEIKVRDVFSFNTIAKLSNHISKLAKSSISPIQPLEKKQYYDVSAAQKRMYVLNELEGENSIAYNMPSVFQVKGDFNVNHFEQQLHVLIQRHEIFRTSFINVNGQIKQEIHPHVEVNLEFLDLTGTQFNERKDMIVSFIKPFDLEIASLIRVKVIKVDKQEHHLLFDMHHIISDGISGKLVLDELIGLYEGKDLPPLLNQYKDFAAWQNEQLETEEMKEQEKYWLQMFNDDIPIMNLLLDYRRPSVQSFEGRTIRFVTGNDLTEDINLLANQANTTVFTVLLAAYNVLLMKYTGQNDIVVGSPVAGRNHPDLQQMNGLFVNTVALRNLLDGKKTFLEFIQHVSERNLNAIENQDYPFEKLIDQLNIKRDTSRNPLFDTMFSFFEAEEQEMNMDGLLLAPYPVEENTAKFDLMLDVYTELSNIRFELQYCTDLYKTETAERLSNHYLVILKELVRNPNILLSEISLLSDKEQIQIKEQFNGKKRDYDFSKTVSERFEEHARVSSHKTALIYKDHRISYEQLNKKANQMARYLRKRGIGPEDIVSVMLERSPKFVESVLGIWKAQAAYVPIDVSYGTERRLNILDDSKAKVVITNSQYLEYELETNDKIKILCLDQMEEDINQEEQDNLNLEMNINDLAYILFTSGSTGKPKGVMIEHVGMLNHILAEADELSLDSSLVFAQNASPCFDISVWQFFGALALGGTTAIYANELILEVDKFSEHLVKDGVTLLEVVPTYLSVLLDHFEDEKVKLPSLSTLMVTGESVKPHLVKRWFAQFPQIKLVNAYGPAEASDDVSQFIIDELPEEENPNISIGKPIANMDIYIVDEEMNLCPIGVVGELCVAGIGVGRGYVNHAEGTNQSFMINKFSNKSNERLYKTGDMARWRSDGNIEFIGRKDYQVKIRGFRIELEEIESAILEHRAVKEAVVITKEEDDEKYLCAYIVVKPNFQLKELKIDLSDKLPDYMLPAYFMLLEQLPLLVSGKIDRKLLPSPDKTNITDQETILPVNDIEEDLVSVWKEVLGVQMIGTDHNFFELGGDSIKAIQMISKFNSKGYSLKTRDLFQYPEIHRLAKCVRKERKEIDQSAVKGEVVLSPIQQWFFERQFKDMNHWNQAVMLFKRDRFDIHILEQVFTKMIEHHDALRMVYHHDDKGENVQFNREIRGGMFDLSVVDICEQTNEEIMDAIYQIQSSLDLEQGPLVKLGLLKARDGDHLFIAIHHLIIDGVSWRILFEDLLTAYKQLSQDHPIQLPSKTDSYLNWTSSLMKYADSKEMLQELSYWKEVEEHSFCPIPKDKEGLEISAKYNQTYQFQLSKEETSELLTRVHATYNTEMNDILLCALGIAVKKWTGENQVCIHLEGHGREEIIKEMDISRTVGWFTSTYPVVLNMDKSEDLSYQIKYLKEHLRQIPNKGIGYGILKYLTSDHDKKDITFVSSPEINFNYLGQFDTDLNTELFEGSELSCGQMVSPNANREVPLDINGLVEEEMLKMEITYNANEFKETTIERFGNLFKQSLSEIIQHCITKESKEITPSDVGGEDLSIEDLEAISAFYES